MLSKEINLQEMQSNKYVKGRCSLLKLIFDKKPIPPEGCDINSLNLEDSAKWTPLTAMAALHRLHEIPKSILTAESLNKKNSAGWTALQRAIVWDFLPEVNYLLQIGADPNVITPEGLTCEDLAKTSQGKHKDQILSTIRKAKKRAEKDKLSKLLDQEPSNLL